MRTLLLLVALAACSKDDGGGSDGDSPRRKKAMAMLNSMEARGGLSRIVAGAREFHAQNMALPSSAPTTPALGSCCTEAAAAVSRELRQEGHKCATDPTLWATPAWEAVGMYVDEPFRASYTLETAGDRLAARAEIDIDCDGTYAVFAIEARVVDGELEIGEMTAEHESE